VAGVGLVVFGVVLSIWQKTTDSSTQPTPTASGGSVDDGVLERLQQLAPTLGGILVAVIVLAGIVLFKGRRHQA
jgi:hypothetical protein